MDKVVINGKIVARSEGCLEIEQILSGNYIYQDIHTFAHKSEYLERHINIAAGSAEMIYGRGTMIDVDQVGESISRLLAENRYPMGSNVVRLLVLPDRWMAICTRQLVYEGFVLWHARPKAITVQYDQPFPTHQTAVSLMCAEVADDYAARCGAEVAICESREGILTGVGDLPLIAMNGDRGSITPITNGAAESVYRDIAVESFAKAGITLTEEPLLVTRSYDEMMMFGPTGVTSIKSCNDIPLYNTIALKASLALPKIV